MAAKPIILEGSDVGDAALAVWKLLMGAQEEAVKLRNKGQEIPNSLLDKISRLTLLERRLERATNGEDQT